MKKVKTQKKISDEGLGRIADYLTGDDKYLLYFLIETGAKLSDALLVRMKHCHFESTEPIITIYADENTSRNIPISRSFARRLGNYLTGKRRLASGELCFYAKYNTLAPDLDLSRERFCRELKGASLTALGHAVSTHDLRKRYAQNLKVQGIDIKEIGARLGIRSLQKTRDILAHHEVSDNHEN